MKYEIKDGRLMIPACEAMRGKTVSGSLDDYCQSSKNRYILVQQKRILLDGVPVTDLGEKTGMRDLVILLEESEPDFRPAEKACTVVYEDAFVFAVHKEPGCIIHGDENDTDCLNAQASRWQIEHGVNAPVRPLHRLDRDTRGLVLYSKIPFFQPWLDRQLQEKKIRRHYLAICYGSGEPGTKFTIDLPIGRDRHRSGAYRVSPTGQYAVTNAEILDRKGKYLLIGCQLETGRTHQIRVHLSHRGFPIVNDPLYGRMSRDFRLMGLWADELEYRSPLSRKKHKIRDYAEEEYDYFEQRRQAL